MLDTRGVVGAWMLLLGGCTSAATGTAHDSGAAGATTSDASRHVGDASLLDARIGDSGLLGPAACTAAGGTCVIGGIGCSNVGPQDCNPSRNPGGAVCCLDQACTHADAQIIKASNYDQTCKASSDCIAVGEGNAACVSCIIHCPSAAINVADEPQYLADVAKTRAGQQAGSIRCLCPISYGPCCIGGICRADSQCSWH